MTNKRLTHSGSVSLAALVLVIQSLSAFAQSVSSHPPSPVIAKISWAPASSIIRSAKSSDLWPTTWADDDNLYTSYGDGYGFNGLTDKSMGFARIIGMPPKFSGQNFTTSADVLKAQNGGPSGRKASSILMVRGVLYTWVRNAAENGTQSELISSRDHGKTWTKASWRFTTSFGFPTFINYGKNYTGPDNLEGRGDGHVYIASHDHPSAYVGTNKMVMARVPLDRLMDRAAYQFFSGIGSAGEPLWTADVKLRQPVFINPGGNKCRRSSITYNPGIKRYLWWQGYPDPAKDQRHDQTGFGVFDSPEPWGPWTTAFTTESWDVAPGESANFPSKWMSADGKNLVLVFSGKDKFSIRNATVSLRASR